MTLPLIAFGAAMWAFIVLLVWALCIALARSYDASDQPVRVVVEVCPPTRAQVVELASRRRDNASQVVGMARPHARRCQVVRGVAFPQGARRPPNTVVAPIPDREDDR